MIMTDNIHKARSCMSMHCSFRNDQRIAQLRIFITNSTEILHINVRCKYVNMWRTISPYFHHACNRSAAWIHPCFLSFIQPRIYHHRQIIFFPSCRRNIFYVPGYRICLKYLLCHCSKNFFPCSTSHSLFN